MDIPFGDVVYIDFITSSPTTGAAAEAIKALAEAVSKPKKIKRDKSGRAIGVE